MFLKAFCLSVLQYLNFLVEGTQLHKLGMQLGVLCGFIFRNKTMGK